MSDAFDTDDGQVGYRKPPVHTRFKPGQSGNPKGRPKGPRNLATELARAMAMPVPVTVNGRRKNVRTITALIWRLREKALGGDHKSLLLLINLIQSHQSEERGQESLTALLAEDAAILRAAGLLGGIGEGDGDQ
jgi:hypothetical protein